MKVPFVNLGLQYQDLKDEILDAIDRVSLKGSYILGPETCKFEEEFATFCGAKFGIGVANATDALTLTLRAIGVGADDEVITVPNSFVATAGSIVNSGARPIFVDVASDYNLDPTKLEAAINSKTKAIVPVHLTGRAACMEEINKIAKNYNIKVVEDAAQAIGAIYQNNPVGSLGDAACFSLHPLKNLHLMGDGGIITTNDPEISKNLKKWRNHGLRDRDFSEFWAYNSRLDNIQSAIGLIKLKHLPKWTQRFRAIAKEYRDNLEGFCKLPAIDPKGCEAVYHNFVIRVPNREKIQNDLNNLGVDTKVHYPIPLHLQGGAKKWGYKKGDFPETEAQGFEILSLPIYPELTDHQVSHVVDSIKKVISNN